MSEPLVSILIPSYKPRHFEIALTSALAQTYANKEIIVSDDCPTEEIAAICARYPLVNYSRNPVRAPNTNLVRLTGLARGAYIKYLLDDDVLHPLCVRQMVDLVEANPSVALVFSARDRIDENDRVISRNRFINAKAPVTILPGDMLRRHCVTNFVNVIGEFSTVMFRRADALWGERETIYTRYHGDHIEGLTDIATFLQLCEKGDVGYLADPLSLFRVHNAANSRDRSFSGYLPGIAEWAIFAKHAQEDAAFTLEDRRVCLEKGRAVMTARMTEFPQLAAELDLMETLLAKLDAAPAPS